MRQGRAASRCSWLVPLVVTAGVLLPAPPAQAQLGVGSRAVASTSSASFALVLASPSGTASTGAPLIVTFPLSLAAASAQYVTAVNQGTATLVAGTYVAQVQGAALGSLTLTACRGGTWNSSTGACPGTVQEIPSSAAGSSTSAVPARPGEVLSLRVRLLAVVSTPVVVTLGASVTSGPGAARQIAPARVTDR